MYITLATIHIKQKAFPQKLFLRAVNPHWEQKTTPANNFPIQPQSLQTLENVKDCDSPCTNRKLIHKLPVLKMALFGRPVSDSLQWKYPSKLIMSLSLMHEWRRLNTYFRRTVHPALSKASLVWPLHPSSNWWFSGKRRESIFSLHEELKKEVFFFQPLLLFNQEHFCPYFLLCYIMFFSGIPKVGKCQIFKKKKKNRVVE